jgi:hypothetical protein
MQPAAASPAGYVLLPAASSEGQQRAMAAALVHALFRHELGEYAVGLMADEAKLALLARLAPGDLAGILDKGQQAAQQKLDAVWQQHSGKQEHAQLDECVDAVHTGPGDSGSGVACSAGDAVGTAAHSKGEEGMTAAVAAAVYPDADEQSQLRAAAATVADVGPSALLQGADQQVKQLLLVSQPEHSSLATVAAVVAAGMPGGEGEEDDLQEMLSLLGV